MGVEVITHPQFLLTNAERAENLKYDSIVVDFWDSIPISMLTLFKIAFHDSSGAIYTPMIEHHPILALYFFVYIFLIAVCLLNLVTAVIVEGSLDQADQDKELAKIHKSQLANKMMPELRDVFHRMDTNHDGTITLDEFGNCDLATQATLYQLFDTDDLVELFEILDVDGGGSVSIDEFFDEMIRLVTTQTPMAQVRLMKQVTFIRSHVFGLQSNQASMMHMLARNTASLSHLHEAIQKIEARLTPDGQTVPELRASQPAAQSQEPGTACSRMTVSHNECIQEGLTTPVASHIL
jgi:hypothetical protein